MEAGGVNIGTLCFLLNLPEHKSSLFKRTKAVKQKVWVKHTISERLTFGNPCLREVKQPLIYKQAPFSEKETCNKQQLTTTVMAELRLEFGRPLPIPLFLLTDEFALFSFLNCSIVDLLHCVSFRCRAQ